MPYDKCPLTKRTSMLSRYLHVAFASDDQVVLSVGDTQRAIIWGWNVESRGAGRLRLHFDTEDDAENTIGVGSWDVSTNGGFTPMACMFKLPMRGDKAADVMVDSNAITDGGVIIYYTLEQIGQGYAA